MNSIIEENETLLRQMPKYNGHSQQPMSTLDTHRVLMRLRVTTERLKALTDQAQAQFKAGDRHATFNKQTIDSVMEPLYNPKRKGLTNG